MTALSDAASFCDELKRRAIVFQVLIARDEALMVSAVVPGERWEVEFFDDGHVEIERFFSRGVVDAEGILSDLLNRFDDLGAGDI